MALLVLILLLLNCLPIDTEAAGVTLGKLGRKQWLRSQLLRLVSKAANAVCPCTNQNENPPYASLGGGLGENPNLKTVVEFEYRA